MSLVRQEVPAPAQSERVADAVATEVFASAQLTTAYQATTALDCHGFDAIDFFVSVDNKGGGSVTKFTVKFETAVGSSSYTVQNADFAPYITESVTSGVATTNVYEVELNDPPLATGLRYIVSVPVRGRWIRAQIKADATSGSNLVSVDALRRVNGEL